MKVVDSFEQNISLPVSIVGADKFKDDLVDKILDYRDNISDKHGEFPVLVVSPNTYVWFKRLFQKDVTFVETVDKTNFWCMEIKQEPVKDGVFSFCMNWEN